MPGMDLNSRLPRDVRERRAYQVVALSAVFAFGFVVCMILWLAGVVNDHPVIVLFIATILTLVRYRMLVGKPR